VQNYDHFLNWQTFFHFFFKKVFNGRHFPPVTHYKSADYQHKNKLQQPHRPGTPPHGTKPPSFY
jgi:hypothetical protein